MKHYLLIAALLLAAGPALAQDIRPTVTPESGSIEALDAKNGFRKFKFGTPISQLPDWQKRAGGAYYTDQMEVRRIGDVDLNTLWFLPYDGKFAAVEFTTFGKNNCQRLLDILVAEYGAPQANDGITMTWIGNVVSMTYELRTSYGGYGTKTYGATVYIGSNEAVAQAKASRTQSAKKAAGDL